MRNLDQSPFHGNEAGSAATNTLALKGAPIVPLIENHAATRERWSLNSVTDSNRDRILRQLPGFELMFKAQSEGSTVQNLKDHVASKNLAFKVSIVTGPSGSYKEHDMLNFLEKWLEPWGPGRRWEIILLDAYAPGLTDAVHRLCWKRGYNPIAHGAGASMVCQTNDTDHHQHVRKRFIEKQCEVMIRKGRIMGGGMVDLTREENIDIMIDVMSDINLHLKASHGYKKTGTTVSLLDDSEDFLICREAGKFWNEMGMREKVNAAVAAVKHRIGTAKTLKWNYKSVRELLPFYPKKGHLDVILPGQEDEATADPDGPGLPYDVADDVADHGDNQDNVKEKEGKEDDKQDSDEEIPEFAAEDWVDGLAAKEIYGDGSQSHGDGVGDVQNHGDGKPSLDGKDIDLLCEQSARMRELVHISRLCKTLDGTIGAQLANTVNKVIHSESKKFNARLRRNPAVDHELRAGLDAEEANYKIARQEFQALMENKKNKTLSRSPQGGSSKAEALQTRKKASRGRGDGSAFFKGVLAIAAGRWTKKRRHKGTSEAPVRSIGPASCRRGGLRRAGRPMGRLPHGMG